MTKYKYICIVPSDGGFGEYDALPADPEYWESAIDLLTECAGHCGEIVSLNSDEDDWPAGIEDIRGRIRGEPDQVYGYLNGLGDPRYFGISETD